MNAMERQLREEVARSEAKINQLCFRFWDSVVRVSRPDGLVLAVGDREGREASEDGASSDGLSSKLQ